MKQEITRVAAAADLHVGKTPVSVLQALLAAAAKEADVLALCGDLTDAGTIEEGRILAKELSAAKLPLIAVLGNHDYEAGKENDIRRLLEDVDVHVLNGEACEVRGVGFAGAKGFGGGFERWSLAPWGEETIKHFVREAIDEALRLESALAKLRTPNRIALLHYAPIRATVEGEPLEIFPFLGSSRLEEPLNRFAVTAVFHGHAHRGAFEGRTRGGVPVYNVALPLMRQKFPDRAPFHVLTVPVGTPA